MVPVPSLFLLVKACKVGNITHFADFKLLLFLLNFFTQSSYWVLGLPFNTAQYVFLKYIYSFQETKTAHYCQPHLCIIVVGSAVLLLHVFSSGCEEGQRVEIFVGWLLSTGHQFPIVEQLWCVAAAGKARKVEGSVREEVRQSEMLRQHTLLSTIWSLEWVNIQGSQLCFAAPSTNIFKGTNLATTNE